MSTLIPAAREALEQRYPTLRASGRVVRLTVDVEVGGQREMVSLQMRGDELVWHCTCGQERCQHAHSALALLAGQERLSSPPPDDRITEMWEPATITTPPSLVAEVRRGVGEVEERQEVRVVEQTDQAAGADTSSLADILDDVLVAVVRSGIRQGASAAIDEALERLIKAAPRPLPLGVSRWLGRLKSALSLRDVSAVARILEGAARLVQDLRAQAPDPEARKRIVSWLGALMHDVENVDRMSDLTLLEVAREWLPGVERSGIERRYLINVDTGSLYREERERDAQTASAGPCPRLVNVGLASIERGAEPRRIRLLQYSTTPAVPQEAWNQVSGWALRSFNGLAQRYRQEVSAFPGLAEPFVLVAPDSVAHDPMPVLLDEAGRSLPLWHEQRPSDLRYWDDLLGQHDQEHATRWIAGRLVDHHDTLALLALSTGTTRRGHTEHRQV